MAESQRSSHPDPKLGNRTGQFESLILDRELCSARPRGWCRTFGPLENAWLPSAPSDLKRLPCSTQVIKTR